METRIYLTNLAKYNEDRLIRKWIELLLTTEELEKELKQILAGDEEYLITDYEAPFRIEEGVHRL